MHKYIYTEYVISIELCPGRMEGEKLGNVISGGRETRAGNGFPDGSI